MLVVAETIRDQLGGNRFVALTGAKNFVGGKDFVQFDLGRGAKYKVTKCRIRLVDDLYTLTLFRWHAKRLEMETVDEAAQIYAEDLQAAFTAATGFATRL